MTTNAAAPPWWEFTLKTPNPEELGALLIDAGAGGAEELSADSVRVFFQGDAAAAEEFEETIRSFGGSVISRTAVQIRNWVQEAQSHWEPLLIGALDIIPVLDSGSHPPPRTNHPIFINPGTGFGTGHHPTTNMVLQLLQHPDVQALPTHSPSLDLGTGSGILALGASELYGAAVDAIEIDPLALENAAKNAALNPAAGSRVQLIEGDLSKAHGPYPLVMANIYAEVLCALEPGFQRAIASNGKLIVSGIMASLKAAVLETYAPWWRADAVMEDRGWAAILFTPRNA